MPLSEPVNDSEVFRSSIRSCMESESGSVMNPRKRITVLFVVAPSLIVERLDSSCSGDEEKRGGEFEMAPPPPLEDPDEGGTNPPLPPPPPGGVVGDGVGDGLGLGFGDEA